MAHPINRYKAPPTSKEERYARYGIIKSGLYEKGGEINMGTKTWKTDSVLGRKKYQRGGNVTEGTTAVVDSAPTNNTKIKEGTGDWEKLIKSIQSSFHVSHAQAVKMLDIIEKKRLEGTSETPGGNILNDAYSEIVGGGEGTALYLQQGTEGNPIQGEEVTVSAKSGVGQQNPLDYIMEHIKGGTFDPNKQARPGELPSRNLDKIVNALAPDADIMKSQGQDVLKAFQEIISGVKSGGKRVVSGGHTIIDKLISMADMDNTSDPVVQEKALQEMIKKPGVMQQILNVLKPNPKMIMDSFKGPHPGFDEEGNPLPSPRPPQANPGGPPQYVTGGRIKKYKKGGALGSLLKVLAVK